MSKDLWIAEVMRECIERADGDIAAGLAAAEFITTHLPSIGQALFSVDASGHEHKGKGPGGGQFVSKSGDKGGLSKDSAKRVKIILEEASRIEVTDEQITSDVSSSDYDAIERSMTESEREYMENALERMADEFIEGAMEGFEPEINYADLSEKLGYGMDGIDSTVIEIIHEHTEDDDELREKLIEAVNDFSPNSSKNRHGKNYIELLKNEIRDVDNVPESLIDDIIDYAYKVESEIDEAISKEEENQRESYEDELRDDYDRAGSDRKEYLEAFYYDNVDRFASEAELNKWYVDSDGDGILKFKTKSDNEYTVRAVYRDVSGRSVPDLQFADSEDSYKITGSGEAFQVFSAVVPAMVSYIREKDLSAATFSAAEESRQKLYDRLVKTVASVVPGYFAAYFDKNGARYYLLGKVEIKDELFKTSRSRFLVEPRTLVEGSGDIFASVNDEEEWKEIKPEINPEWFTEEGWKSDNDKNDKNKDDKNKEEKALSIALAHDIHNPAAQSILERSLKAAKGLSAAARKDLDNALKQSQSGSSQAILEFVDKYRTQLARLLTSTQLASLLEGAREVAEKVPTLAEFPGAIPPPPTLEPHKAVSLVNKLEQLTEEKRAEEIYTLSPAEQVYVKQALASRAAPPTNIPPIVAEGMDPEDVHFPIIENAVKNLAERNVMDRQRYDALDAAARAKAFTVANVAAEETLTKLRDSLAENVAKGADYETWRKKVMADVDEGTFLSDAHQETVFRTNVQTAFSDGQAKVLAHPLVRSGFPYSFYNAIHDDRVRENHLALEKLGIGGTNVYRNDDPVFNLFRPPWDYNDRCNWTPATVRQAAEAGIEEAKRWLETGIEPTEKAFVEMPPFQPPEGFKRELLAAPLSIQLSLQPISAFSTIDEDGHWVTTEDDRHLFISGKGHLMTKPGGKVIAKRNDKKSVKKKSSVENKNNVSKVEHTKNVTENDVTKDGLFEGYQKAIAISAARNIENGANGVVVRDKNKIIGIASYQFDKKSGEIYVKNLASAKKGTGTQLMKQLASIASKKNVGMYLEGQAKARGFYEKLGMRMVGDAKSPESNVAYEWSPKEVKKFSAAFSTDAHGHEHKGKGPGGGQFTKSDDARPTPKTEEEAHTAAQKRAQGWLKRAASLPGNTVKYANKKVAAAYKKLEAKYGKRWAKAIIAVGIVTFPTPFTTGAVLATCAVARLSNKLFSKPQPKTKGAAMSSDDEPTDMAIEPIDLERAGKIGRKFIKKLAAQLDKIDVGDDDNQSAPFATDDNSGTWITIGGRPDPKTGEKHVGGMRVKVGKGGRILTGRLKGEDVGDIHGIRRRLKKLKSREGSNNETEQGQQQGTKPTGKQSEETSGQVEKPPSRPDDKKASQGGKDEGKSTSAGSTKRIPANQAEVNRRLEQYEKLFRSRGNNKVADWMGMLRNHVAAVGTDKALESLGAEVKGGPELESLAYEGEKAGWESMDDFAHAYLNRHGITPVFEADAPTKSISSLSGAFKQGGAEDGYLTGDLFFQPSDPKLKDKLEEAKHLPGLETSEDISKIMGKPTGTLSPDVLDALDKKYGKDNWIVKPYDDSAFAGFGVFFPQRVRQIIKDAQNTVWESGERLARYGFQLARSEDGKVAGLRHENGHVYRFDSQEYNNSVYGEVKHWADRAAAAARNEQGVPLLDREGKLMTSGFMAQPAFKAAGVSEEDRRLGRTFEGGVLSKGEGRVHIITRNGKAEIIPHSAWMKGEWLPVVFETEETKAMAQAALDAINALPESERQGQVYAPDIMRAESGYRVVEANPSNQSGPSGYLGDNPFIIDSYVSSVLGREPAHVRFIRKLLTKRERGKERTK